MLYIDERISATRSSLLLYSWLIAVYLSVWARCICWEGCPLALFVSENLFLWLDAHSWQPIQDGLKTQPTVWNLSAPPGCSVEVNELHTLNLAILSTLPVVELKCKSLSQRLCKRKRNGVIKIKRFYPLGSRNVIRKFHSLLDCYISAFEVEIMDKRSNSQLNHPLES